MRNIALALVLLAVVSGCGDKAPETLGQVYLQVQDNGTGFLFYFTLLDKDAKPTRASGKATWFIEQDGKPLKCAFQDFEFEAKNFKETIIGAQSREPKKLLLYSFGSMDTRECNDSAQALTGAATLHLHVQVGDKSWDAKDSAIFRPS
jgi:hypothetical protein